VHTADLLATAAVASQMDLFNDKPASHSFKAQRMRVIDARSSVVFVWRAGRMNVLLPSFAGFHWAERLFKRTHPRKCRA